MDKLKNPIIPGFYPDPTIIRVGEDYYLACSSFELCPGIPLFHSRDLVHWEQICNVMTCENEFHMEKSGMVGGVMAPTLRYHNGTYYIINANFSDRGNFIVTATHPAGPWSKPHWLTDVPGIDASMFFDDDGRCYILGTGEVWDNGAGKKEHGIWLAEYDIENFSMINEPVTIFNSALRVGASPEAPHLYHIGDYYYLMIAEGGTEHHHAVMVARSKELFGFYEGNPANPVMTHRHMGYACPIANVGHADLVQTPAGDWYAVMLASRLVDGVGKNLGRETFLCPVLWERDWPLFSPMTGKIEWEYEAPALLQTAYEPLPAFCTFEKDITGPGADLRWAFWGRPYESFHKVKDGRLYLSCIWQRADEELAPINMTGGPRRDAYAAIVAQRQTALHQTVTTKLSFIARNDEAAGLILFQSMNHQLHFVKRQVDGLQKLTVILVTCDYDCPQYFPHFKSNTHREVLGETNWEADEVVLEIEMEGQRFTCRYGSSLESLSELCVADGARMNPEKVGCMVGTMMGMYATGGGVASENKAAFAWYQIR